MRQNKIQSEENKYDSSVLILFHSRASSKFGQMKAINFRSIVRSLIYLPAGFQNSIRSVSSCTLSEMRVLFLGGDDFSIGSLEILKDLVHKDLLNVVVSHSSNLVAKFSKHHSLKVVPWNDLKGGTLDLDKPDFDIGVVASFGYLIPERIIQRCRMGILNVHASLLPRWRGASPICHAIMNGDTITGISIMKIAPHKFDVGPVLYRIEVPLHPHVRAPELRAILAETGGFALKEVLQKLDFYLPNAVPQDISEGTLAPKVTSEMSEVQWDTKNAVEIYNQYRGLCGFFKLRTNYLNRSVDLDELAIYTEEVGQTPANTNVNVETIKAETDFRTFYEAPVTVKPRLPKSKAFKPGDIYFSNNFICVKCFSQNDESPLLNWVFVGKIKVGSKWMSAIDFRNGFLSKTKGTKCFSNLNVNSIRENRVG